MSTVTISPTVRIVRDGVCVTLEHSVVPAKGKSAGEARWVALGYYPDLRTACLALLERHYEKLADVDEAAGVNDVIAAIGQARDAIVESLR